MSLSALHTIQLQGLAPSLFVGKMLADLGAQVTFVAKPEPSDLISFRDSFLNDGKKIVTIALKDRQGLAAVKQLIKTADILIDPYRPIVLSRLGLGPDVLRGLNPRLVVLRVSGYGQHSQQPGHDINYLARAGTLRQLNLQFPNNLVADFAGVTVGLALALVAVQRARLQNKAFQVDFSLLEGAAFVTKAAAVEGQVRCAEGEQAAASLSRVDQATLRAALRDKPQSPFKASL